MIIDIRESISDIQEALTTVFGLSPEVFDETVGKQAVAELTRIFVQHDYLSWLTNHPAETATMAARMASVFYRHKFTDAYVKCKAISEALTRIEGLSDPDDAPEELQRLQYLFDDFIEKAFCTDDSLTSTLTADKDSRSIVCQIQEAPGESARLQYLLAEPVLVQSSVARAYFKSNTEYNDMIRSFVITD